MSDDAPCPNPLMDLDTEQRLDALMIENSPDAKIAIDRDGMIRRVNRQAEFDIRLRPRRLVGEAD